MGMTQRRYSPLATSINALGANSLVGHMVVAVRNYPACRQMDNAQISDIISSFNDQQLLKMAALVLYNAQIDNQKALAQTSLKVKRTHSKKAEAKHTTEIIKAGLLIRAQRFLNKGVTTDAPTTAKQLRHLTQLWCCN